MHWEVLRTEKCSRWQSNKIIKKFTTEEEAKSYKSSIKGYSEIYIVNESYSNQQKSERHFLNRDVFYNIKKALFQIKSAKRENWDNYIFIFMERENI